MTRWAVLALGVAAACAGPDGRGQASPDEPAPTVEPAPPVVAATVVAPPVVAAERWLKGSTHVHARPSGDSSTPIPDVVRWYAEHGYDFFVLTDHNKVSVVDEPRAGSPALEVPEAGPIVFAGVELTHNPDGCQPAGDPSGKCRIHVNLLGVTARPTGKLDWADRSTRERLPKYEAALRQQQQLGGVIQLNHPTWFGGMTVALLTALAARGVPLVEIANVQFARWNQGDADHPGTEQLWDGALVQGATLWGVASDDAHDYTRDAGAAYPAGGGWVMVWARREPQAILDALAAGRFYASTGVVLARADVEDGALVVEVAAGEGGAHTIEWIEDGVRVARGAGPLARRAVPARGYLRAVVTRDDGARAWVQPRRRPAP